MSNIYLTHKKIVKNLLIIIFSLLPLFVLSCSNKNKSVQENGYAPVEETENTDDSIFSDMEEIILTIKIKNVLSSMQLPQHLESNIQEIIIENTDFLQELMSIIQKDRYLWILVDRNHSLGKDYEPDDLVDLKSTYYDTFRVAVGQKLRTIAAASLEEMAIAAHKEGLRLFIGSSYRSYSEQINSYARHVNRLGPVEADRVSTHAGHSQHQLGLTVDFGYATYEFSRTKEYVWLMNNASAFGWSLSYPRHHEAVTGFNWEPWHFRYVGTEISEFINKYFDGIQQYALMFIHNFYHF